MQENQKAQILIAKVSMGNRDSPFNVQNLVNMQQIFQQFTSNIFLSLYLILMKRYCLKNVFKMASYESFAVL